MVGLEHNGKGIEGKDINSINIICKYVHKVCLIFKVDFNHSFRYPKRNYEQV